MFSEECIHKIQCGCNVQTNMQQLYSENLGLLHTICNSLHLSSDDRDEFYQFSYIALDKAVKAYDPRRGFSFLAYYRLCLRHEYYVYRLQMKFPVRLDQRAMHDHAVQESKAEWADYLEPENDDHYDLVEDAIIAKAIWQEVCSLLSKENADIVVCYYKKNETYSSLSKKYGICINAVRKRVLRSLKILQGSSILREIARDYYGIRKRR